MNEYIFYTTEGDTNAPNDTFEVENCQVLGIASGTNQENALKNLLAENPWIDKAGFDAAKFIVKQLLTEEQRADTLALIDYLEAGEFTFRENRQAEIHAIGKRLRHI